MKRKPVSVVDVGILDSWRTKQLLGRLKALQMLEDRPEFSDKSSEEIEAISEIQFKSDPRWTAAHFELKEVLATREHVSRGKVQRRARADARA